MINPEQIIRGILRPFMFAALEEHTVRNLYFILIFLSIISCFREKPAGTPDIFEDISEPEVYNDEINFSHLRSIVDKADKLSPEVFFAITALHRNYIEETERAVDSGTSGNFEKLFEEKRIEFFKTIKFDYDQYMNYYENNQEEMNEYIMQKPELLKYLTILK